HTRLQGDWSSDVCSSDLEGLARERGVAAGVTFAGAVDRATLTEYLARAHLVLAPSAYEGFGIAVIEAMASGSLVIGNTIEAHREIGRASCRERVVRGAGE